MRCSCSGPAPVPRSLCGPLRLPRGCGRIMDMTCTGMVMGLVSEWPRGCQQPAALCRDCEAAGAQVLVRQEQAQNLCRRLWFHL